MQACAGSVQLLWARGGLLEQVVQEPGLCRSGEVLSCPWVEVRSSVDESLAGVDVGLHGVFQFGD